MNRASPSSPRFARALALIAVLLAPNGACGGSRDLSIGRRIYAGGTVPGSDGASGAGGASLGGSVGTMASGGTTGGGGSVQPVMDAGILVESWIAFDSNGGAFNRDIYVIRADGTGRRRLTTEISVETQPSFSRDGTKLAFASDRDGGVMQIYLMDLATGLATLVTQRTEGAHDPTFTLDGTRVGYRSGISVFTAKL